MSVELIVIVVTWCAICTVWAGLLVAQFGAKRRGLMLEVKPEESRANRAGGGTRHPTPCSSPTICVVIPAHNEAATLAQCLRSVLKQDCATLSVVVVEDRSEDETAAIADDFARSDPRVRVQRIDMLPPGWLGKSHALWRATRSITSDWLLFLDSDCTLSPGALPAVVKEALSGNADLLTLWPRSAAVGFLEHMVIPLCGGIIALWFGSHRVNDTGSRLAFANGQFILIRRDAYERIDGHRSVRRALIEDIPLAERAKRAGIKCRVASGRDLVSVRMYSDYRAIRDGWARIYAGALRSGWKIMLSIVWLLLGSLLPFLAAVVLYAPQATDVVELRVGSSGRLILQSVCAGNLFLMAVVSYRFWGMGGCDRRHLFLYPLSVLVVIRILARAWWWLIVVRSVHWGKTRYRIDRRGVIVG